MYYFSQRVNTEVKEMYWQVAIANLALSMTIVFEPIFLYRLGYSPAEILKFFLIVYVGYSLLITPIAKITSYIGYKHSIFIANCFYIIYWFALYRIASVPSFFYFAPWFYALQKSFFWPPYHSDISINSIKRQGGREVGVLFSLIQVASIVGPFIGGAISAVLGFKALFFTSSLLIMLSAYPLFRSPEIYPRHRFHFRNFWKILNRHWQNFFGYWGYAEDLMLMSLWPIYIFLIVPSFLNIGLLSTVASFIAVMLMLYVGKLSDRMKNQRLLVQLTSTFYGLTWLTRWWAQSFGSVFVFDTLTRTGKGLVNVPMTALTYGQAGSKTVEHAAAYSVFYEFSLAIGKIVTALLGIWILTATGNIFYVFILTGALTMFYGLLKK